MHPLPSCMHPHSHVHLHIISGPVLFTCPAQTDGTTYITYNDKCGPRSWAAWVQIGALPLPGWATLDKDLWQPVPQFPSFLRWGKYYQPPHKVIWGLNILLDAEHLDWNLAHREHSMNILLQQFYTRIACSQGHTRHGYFPAHWHSDRHTQSCACL